jgi:hypothetical protein
MIRGWASTVPAAGSTVSYANGRQPPPRCCLPGAG